VGFVNLFIRQGKRARGQAVDEQDGQEYIGVIDTASVTKEDYTTHRSHLNSGGKERIVNLIIIA
jgi:hypothetical protein